MHSFKEMSNVKGIVLILSFLISFKIFFLYIELVLVVSNTTLWTHFKELTISFFTISKTILLL